MSAADNSSHNVANWSLVALLTSRVLTTAVYYGAMPFELIVYPRFLPISATEVAAYLAGLLFVTRILALPAGRIVDLIGPKRTLVAASAVLAASNLALAFLPGPASAVLHAVIISTTAVIFNIAYRVAVARTNDANRSINFGYLASANNAGVVIGPLIATVTISNSLEWALLAALGAGSLVACAIQSTLPRDPAANATKAAPAGTVERHGIKRVQVMGALLSVAVSWAFIQVIILALPIYSAAVFGGVGAASVFFAVQATSVIPLLPTAGKAIKTLEPQTKLLLAHVGSLLIPIGLAIFSFASPLGPYAAALLLAVFVTAGEAIAAPTMDTIVAEASDSKDHGRAFGIAATTQAFGMGAGGLLASLLTITPPIFGSMMANFAAVGLIGTAAIACTVTVLLVLHMRAPRRNLQGS